VGCGERKCAKRVLKGGTFEGCAAFGQAKEIKRGEERSRLESRCRGLVINNETMMAHATKTKKKASTLTSGGGVRRNVSATRSVGKRDR